MAKGNRKKATEALLKIIDGMMPGNKNVKLYKDYLGKMSDAQFGEFIERLKNREEYLTFINPNWNETLIQAETLMDNLRSFGVEPLKRVWMVDETTTPFTRYLTNDPYLTIMLPVKRQNQLLIKKLSTAQNSLVRDDLTGQPTGISKAASLSNPEVQMLYGQGFDKVIEENLKAKGGDETAYRAMNWLIYNQGSATTEQLANLDSRVTSTDILNVLLRCMHYDANF